MADEGRKTYEELFEENEVLKQKLSSYERNAELGKGTLRQLFTLGRTIFLGPSLDNRLKQWLEAVKRGNLVPTEETANVIAAVIRRRMGFYILAIMGTFGALSTTGLLIWQNMLLQRQVRQQAEQDTLTRRAQLLQILYDQNCVDEAIQSDTDVEETVEICTPVSDARSRTEAAKVFIAIERESGILTPDLSRSLLSDVELSGADLSGVILNGTILRGAFLSRANLRKASLSRVDLSGMHIPSTNLREAKLWEVDFSKAWLIDADFRGAALVKVNLRQAVLLGTNLGDADLRSVELNEAIYDSYTVFPESFEMLETMCFFEPGDPNGCLIFNR